MARIEIASSKNVVVITTKSRIESIITWAKTKATFTIRVNAMTGVSAADLLDYADGLRKACKKTAAIIGKEVAARGTRIDPDEPTQIPGADITVTFQIFPKDTTKHLTFTRYAEDGRVKASVQGWAFSETASAMQVAYVAEQAANLMKLYAKV